MEEVLLITPTEMTAQTIISGNVDFDRYTWCVLDAQLRVLEPLLGTELYDKILEDAKNDTLTGLYLELYTDFVKPIVKFTGTATYLEVAPYLVDNGGIFKHAPENKEVVVRDEVMQLVQKYNGLCDMFIIRFNKWICKNPLDEYKTYQDRVNATKNIRTTFGWKL